MSNLASFLIGVLVTLFAMSLRMVVGIRVVKFSVRKENTFTLVKDGPLVEHEMQIKFSLSKFMTIVNWMTFFPPKREPVTAEIRDIERKLKYLDDEQEKLLDQSLRGFPEDIIIKENGKINKSRENLGARKSELENKVLQAKTTMTNMDSIEAFCKLARKNIDNFTFEDKRLALRALQVKVVADREEIALEVAIPEASSFGNLQPTM